MVYIFNYFYNMKFQFFTMVAMKTTVIWSDAMYVINISEKSAPCSWSSLSFFPASAYSSVLSQQQVPHDLPQYTVLHPKRRVIFFPYRLIQYLKNRNVLVNAMP
jgi:hypothetical protein